MLHEIKKNIENNKTINGIRKFWPSLELFLITGPTLIGWVPGILKYEYYEERFKLGMQSMAVFLLYIAMLILNQIIVSMNIGEYKYYAFYIDSFFCLLYLITCFYLYKRAKIRNTYLHPFLFRVLDNLNYNA